MLAAGGDTVRATADLTAFDVISGNGIQQQNGTIDVQGNLAPLTTATQQIEASAAVPPAVPKSAARRRSGRAELTNAARDRAGSRVCRPAPGRDRRV